MKLSEKGLIQLLQANVVELKFTRRHISSNRPSTRRMIASLNPKILDSDLGRNILNFKPPTNKASYNPNKYNLLFVFDLFMQNWRAIPDSAEVIRVLPSNPASEFWDYFSTSLAKMTSAQKAAFMDQ